MSWAHLKIHSDSLGVNGAEICLDGKPLNGVTHIELIGAVDDIWQAKITLLTEVDIDVVADIEND